MWPKGLAGNTKSAGLRRWAFVALYRHREDGTLPTSLRHLFYEAVMAGVVVKGATDQQKSGRRADQDLTNAVTWLREAGYVPWEWIEDRTRHTMDRRGHGDSILDALDEVLDGLRIDIWRDHVAPLLVVESESAAGVLAGIAYTYRVVVVPTRGQANGWLRTHVAEHVGERDMAVGYLGDADKAGGDIERNTMRVLRDVLGVVGWRRLALTWEQVEDHGLPTVHRTDKRTGITYEVCELEALPQRLLLDDVTEWLGDLLPAGIDLNQIRERETAERDEIRSTLGSAS